MWRYRKVRLLRQFEKKKQMGVLPWWAFSPTLPYLQESRVIGHPRYGIVDTAIKDRPGQLIFHTILSHLIVEAHNRRVMAELPVQYGAITSAVQFFFSFPITCTVLMQLPRLYLRHEVSQITRFWPRYSLMYKKLEWKTYRKSRENRITMICITVSTKLREMM